MPAFLLADLLRSLHYGLPTAITALDYLAPLTSTNLAALKIYEMSVVEGRSPPPELGKDGSMLSLIIILADIHNLQCVFHPLSAPVPAIRRVTSSDECNPDRFYNPYVPFTAANETRLTRRKLQLALDLWAATYLSVSPRSVATLFYFSRMYLAIPSLQFLPALANYPPRLSQDGPVSREGQQRIDEDLINTPEAAKLAWQILEHVDQGPEMTASWLPIAVFFASLVIWRAVMLEVDSAAHGSRRVLLLFKQELAKMCWPCCNVMVATLDALLA